MVPSLLAGHAWERGGENDDQNLAGGDDLGWSSTNGDVLIQWPLVRLVEGTRLVLSPFE